MKEYASNRNTRTPLQKSLQNWMPKDIGPDMRDAGPELVLGRAVIMDYSDSRVLDRLMLYEKRIESSLHKAMRELERRQIIRQYRQQEDEQEQSIPIPINDNRDEAATPDATAEKNGDLKKQSQWEPAAKRYSAGHPAQGTDCFCCAGLEMM